MDELLLTQLKKISKMYSLPYQTIEKDYALTDLLLTVSKFPKLNKMIFKGGTSLKKIHFNDFRFSEDLDFTCNEDVSDDLVSFLLDNTDNMNFDFTRIDIMRNCKFPDWAQ